MLTKRSANSQLILVKTAVSVLSKTKYELLNPNGWYCLKSKVAILAKTQILLDCSSRFTTPKSNLVILGEDKSQEGGLTILGKTRIKRINCKK